MGFIHGHIGPVDLHIAQDHLRAAAGLIHMGQADQAVSAHGSHNTVPDAVSQDITSQITVHRIALVQITAGHNGIPVTLALPHNQAALVIYIQLQIEGSVLIVTAHEYSSTLVNGETLHLKAGKPAHHIHIVDGRLAIAQHVADHYHIAGTVLTHRYGQGQIALMDHCSVIRSGRCLVDAVNIIIVLVIDVQDRAPVMAVKGAGAVRHPEHFHHGGGLGSDQAYIHRLAGGCHFYIDLGLVPLDLDGIAPAVQIVFVTHEGHRIQTPIRVGRVQIQGVTSAIERLSRHRIEGVTVAFNTALIVIHHMDVQGLAGTGHGKHTLPHPGTLGIVVKVGRLGTNGDPGTIVLGPNDHLGASGITTDGSREGLRQNMAVIIQLRTPAAVRVGGIEGILHLGIGRIVCGNGVVLVSPDSVGIVLKDLAVHRLQVEVSLGLSVQTSDQSLTLPGVVELQNHIGPLAQSRFHITVEPGSDLIIVVGIVPDVPQRRKSSTGVLQRNTAALPAARRTLAPPVEISCSGAVLSLERHGQAAVQVLLA